MGIENLLAMQSGTTEEHIGKAIGTLRAAERFIDRDPVAAKRLINEALHILQPTGYNTASENVEYHAQQAERSVFTGHHLNDIRDELGIPRDRDY